MPEEVFLHIFRFLCLGKCFFSFSGTCAWESVSSYLQVPVPMEVLLLILR